METSARVHLDDLDLGTVTVARGERSVVAAVRPGVGRGGDAVTPEGSGAALLEIHGVLAGVDAAERLAALRQAFADGRIVTMDHRTAEVCLTSRVIPVGLTVYQTAGDEQVAYHLALHEFARDDYPGATSDHAPRPVCVLRAGAQRFDSGAGDGPIERVEVVRDADAGYAEASITLGRDAPRPAVADPASITLGYHGGPAVTVMTGRVAEVEPSAHWTRVRLEGPEAALGRALVIHEPFERRTVGDVVRAVAAAAGARVGRIDPGPVLPRYALDPDADVLSQLRDLADTFGLDLHVRASGELVLVTPGTGGGHHRVRVPVELLSFTSTVSSTDGRAIDLGGDAVPGWRWLVRDPDPPKTRVTRRIRRGVFRSQAALASASASVAAALVRRARAGEAVLLGRPEIDVGDTVFFEGGPGALPEALPDAGTVRRVRHELDVHEGMTTAIRFEESGGGATGGRAWSVI